MSIDVKDAAGVTRTITRTSDDLYAALTDTNPSVVVSLTDIVSATAALTRPTEVAAYAVGQLIGQSATAGSVVPLQFDVARVNGGTGNIRRMRLFSSNAGSLNAQIRVHLYRNLPTTTVGDKGTFAGAVNGVASLYMGAFDVTLSKAFSDGCGGTGLPEVGSEVNFKTKADPSGSITVYALLEARSVFTPGNAEVFTPRAETFRD